MRGFSHLGNVAPPGCLKEQSHPICLKTTLTLCISRVGFPLAQDVLGLVILLSQCPEYWGLGSEVLYCVLIPLSRQKRPTETMLMSVKS